MLNDGERCPADNIHATIRKAPCLHLPPGQRPDPADRIFPDNPLPVRPAARHHQYDDQLFPGAG